MASIKRFHLPSCRGGACECLWVLDYRPLGLHGPRQRLRFKTRKEAERYRTETCHKASRGEYVEPAKVPTLRQAAAEFLRSKSNRHPASLNGYRVQVNLHLIPPLGDLKLDQISVAVIEKLRDCLLVRMQPQTVSKVMSTLAAVFKLAMRRGYVGSNPAAIAERPRRAVAEINDAAERTRTTEGVRSVQPQEMLSGDEIARMLAHSEPGLYRMLFATIAGTGLRTEEAYALRWADVQFDGDGRGRLFVRQALSWSRTDGEVGRIRPKFYEPKTKSGRRAIPLSPYLSHVLKTWKLRCPASECDLIFCREDGGPLRRSNVLRQGLYPALRRAKLRHVNVKSLRHSFASMMIMAGAPVTEVAHLMGHADPSVTLRVYSHWFRSVDSGAVDRVADNILASFNGAESGGGESGHYVGTQSLAPVTQVA
jgi:integrase